MYSVYQKCFHAVQEIFFSDSGKPSKTRIVTAAKGEMSSMLAFIYNKLFSFP